MDLKKIYILKKYVLFKVTFQNLKVIYMFSLRKCVLETSLKPNLEVCNTKKQQNTIFYKFNL